MRCFVMFVTAVCIPFLFKLKWPKNEGFYEKKNYFTVYCLSLLDLGARDFRKPGYKAT